MLTWSETDVTEFFGRPALYDEESDMYTFSASKNGVLLELSLIPAFGEVYLDICREGWDEPVIRIKRSSCSHAQVYFDPKKRRVIDIGRPEHAVTNMGIPPLLYCGFRIYIEPQISLELIEPKDKG